MNKTGMQRTGGLPSAAFSSLHIVSSSFRSRTEESSTPSPSTPPADPGDHSVLLLDVLNGRSIVCLPSRANSLHLPARTFSAERRSIRKRPTADGFALLEDGSAGVSAIFKAVVDAAVEAAARVRLLRQIVCPNCDAEEVFDFGVTDTSWRNLQRLSGAASARGHRRWKAPMTAPAN